jgi:hypothetical protein
MTVFRRFCAAGALAGGLGSLPALADNPFTLVNVIDLFEFFDSPVPLDVNDPGFPVWDPATGPPPNYATYRAEPRIGTNPSAVTVHDGRMWVAGFANVNNYGTSTNASKLAWYNSLGAGEVQNIYTTSGFDGSVITYNQVVNFGPGVRSTDSYTGIDFDPVNQILYVAHDDVSDQLSLPPGADPQQRSFIAAVDADPNSATYGQFLWKLSDPINPPASPFDSGDRFYGGLAVDVLNPQYLYVAQNGGPFSPTFGFGVFDAAAIAANPGGYTFDPNNDRLNLKDNAAECGASFYRQVAMDADGDLFTRNANAVEWIPRSGVGSPFAAVSLDPNDPLNILNERPIGNTDVPGDDGDCNDDTKGFGNGPFGQGQGVAIVRASDLEGVVEDLIVANNRRTFGANQPKDVRVVTKSGVDLGQLELPCSPVAGPSTGLAIYDMDYDETTGTLVVVEMEQRKAYVFRAQLDGGPAIPRYDFTRNGDTNIADFAALQDAFTGAEFPGPLTLNNQRLNSDSDCDIDLTDWDAFAAVLNAP